VSRPDLLAATDRPPRDQASHVMVAHQAIADRFSFGPSRNSPDRPVIQAQDDRPDRSGAHAPALARHPARTGTATSPPKPRPVTGTCLSHQQNHPIPPTLTNTMPDTRIVTASCTYLRPRHPRGYGAFPQYRAPAAKAGLLPLRNYPGSAQDFHRVGLAGLMLTRLSPAAREFRSSHDHNQRRRLLMASDARNTQGPGPALSGVVVAHVRPPAVPRPMGFLSGAIRSAADWLRR
jgi:hypothetical protein